MGWGGLCEKKNRSVFFIPRRNRTPPDKELSDPNYVGGFCLPNPAFHYLENQYPTIRVPTIIFQTCGGRVVSLMCLLSRHLAFRVSYRSSSRQWTRAYTRHAKSSETVKIEIRQFAVNRNLREYGVAAGVSYVSAIRRLVNISSLEHKRYSQVAPSDKILSWKVSIPKKKIKYN